MNDLLKQALVLGAAELADGYEMPMNWEVLFEGKPVNEEFFRRRDDMNPTEVGWGIEEAARESEVLATVREARDWFRGEIDAGDHDLLKWERRLTRAVELLMEA